MDRTTPQNMFSLCNRATLNVAAGTSADVNTYGLTYLTAIEKVNIATVQTVRKLVPRESGNQAILRFLINHATDANAKTARCKLWQWSGPSAGQMLFEVELTGGPAVETVYPDQSALGGTGVWHYADTITVVTDNVCGGLEYRGESNGGGIYECLFDLLGGRYLWLDFDCDAGGGDSATDAIGLVKFI